MQEDTEKERMNHPCIYFEMSITVKCSCVFAIVAAIN